MNEECIIDHGPLFEFLDAQLDIRRDGKPISIRDLIVTVEPLVVRVYDKNVTINGGHIENDGHFIIQIPITQFDDIKRAQ